VNRTQQQNKALHKYCELLAEALNDAGFDQKVVLSYRTVDVPWDKDRVKLNLWQDLQKAMFGKKHTSELSTGEVNEVYEVLDRWTAQHFGIHVPFPNREEE